LPLGGRLYTVLWNALLNKFLGSSSKLSQTQILSILIIKHVSLLNASRIRLLNFEFWGIRILAGLTSNFLSLELLTYEL
jgi:hypothetical protein